ncbi:lytic polysaccharide monooxygenase [Photobacterium aquae]|uniref:lytic polysaccharide monooxygenase n=1 Tax=Photobacterium aquae TaxID=1195763 RepID=UPI00069F8012|nr:lytic polysaccharide monooxygenase [Photobacterium aquae]
MNKEGMLLSLMAVATVLGPTGQAKAHGWADYPKARQVFCHEGGGYWGGADGAGIANRACREAFKASGTYQFTQHNEFAAMVRDYNSMAAVKQAVGDGLICSGGDERKRGMSIPSGFWQRTKMQPGETFSLRYRATAPHVPGFWQVYLSKPGYDAARTSLRWRDLELIGTAGNIKPRNEGEGQYFVFDVTLPRDRRGDATLVTRWQREDPAGEGFYNCSDIRIGSGSGGIVSGKPVPDGDHGDDSVSSGGFPFTVTGIQDQYQVGKEGHSVISAIVRADGKFKAEMVMLSGNGRIIARDSSKLSRGQAALALLADEAGKFTVRIKVTPLQSNGKPTVVSHSIRVIGKEKPTQEHDYTYPDGIGSYVVGETVVLGRDGNTYQCRPFPEGGWCNVNSAIHYEPGFGSVWQDAWTKL